MNDHAAIEAPLAARACGIANRLVGLTGAVDYYRQTGRDDLAAESAADLVLLRQRLHDGEKDAVITEMARRLASVPPPAWPVRCVSCKQEITGHLGTCPRPGCVGRDIDATVRLERAIEASEQ